MAAFGWSYDELEATSSGLTDSIRQYTDLEQLARELKDLTITQCLKYLEVKGGPSSKEKRRCSDSGDARPVKRVRPLQGGEPGIPGEQEMSMTGLLPVYEELDITDMTGLLPMPGEQEMSMTGLLPVHEELDMTDMTGLLPMPGEQEMSMEGLLPMPGEQEMPTITWLSPMPGEPEMTNITGLLPIPEEVPTSTGMEPFERLGMSTMQPTQTLELDASMMSIRRLTTECPQTYENWADDTQGWM
jgi:hypothetical protein